MLKLGLELSLSRKTEAFLSCTVRELIAAFKPQPQPVAKLTVVRVTDRATGLSIEGANLNMNLKNTEQVDLEVKPKNRLGGPATGVTGVYSAVTPTSAFTVEADAANPLKAVLKGNPNAAGGTDDIGLVHFEGSRTASDGTTQPVVAELAVNILAADAATIEISAGTPSEQ